VKISALGDWRFGVALGVVVAFLDSWSSAHGQRWGDLLALVYFVAYAWYCIQNFVACGEVHCAVTGPAFAISAILIILRILGVRDIGYALPWEVVICAVIIGYGIQTFYSMRHGTGSVKRH
jgi:hypothetical protein